MALATKCPHCNTIFRVASDQLKLRGGIVRCGSCQQIFDGNAALLDPAAALLTETPPLAGMTPAFQAPAFEAPAVEPAIDTAQPGATPDVDVDVDAPPSLAPDTETVPEPQTLATLDQPDEIIVATSLPDDHKFVPLTRSRSEPAATAPAPAPKIAEPEIVEPNFVKQGKRRLRTGKSVRILMNSASFLLLLALLAQVSFTFRNQLAAQVPELKPALLSICAVLGCRVELLTQIEHITIEQGELQTLSEITFSYATVLHNQSSSAQAWPDIELILNDGNDQPVLRRVFTSREYLPAPLAQNQGFAARSEQAVKLYFELAGLKPSGYHIAVFYP